MHRWPRSLELIVRTAIVAQSPYVELFRLRILLICPRRPRHPTYIILPPIRLASNAAEAYAIVQGVRGIRSRWISIHITSKGLPSCFCPRQTLRRFLVRVEIHVVYAFDIDWRTPLKPCCEPKRLHEKRIVVNHVCMYVCAAMPLNAAMQFVTVRSRHCRFNRNAHRKCGNAASMCEGLRHCRAYMLRHCRFAQSTCGIAARSKLRWACGGM